MSQRHSDLVRRLREAVLGRTGVTHPALRQAVEARAAMLGGRSGTAAGVPVELSSFVDKVARCAYTVTDADVQALREAGYSEDAIFEVAASATLGAATARLERGLAALAKTLSMDLRAKDSAWVRLKLDALATVQEERAFEMPFPPHGERRLFPGVVAATAAVVRWRCEQLGLWDNEKAATPVIDAMFSQSEPHTGPSGTLAWAVDIENHSTGEDFTLTLKEVLLPVLQIPMTFPVILSAVQATSLVMSEDSGGIAFPLSLLGIFSTVYLTASYFVFEYVVEE